MKYLKNFGNLCVDLIFPRRCPVCDNPVKPFGKLICDSCIPKVKYVGKNKCLKCGKPVEDEIIEYCGDCMRIKHIYDRGFSVFEYASIADSIYRFKYRNRREYAAFYGECMAARIGTILLSLGVEAIVPVPIHRSKQRSRGYNQAKLLADELSKRINIPVRDDLIIRSKKTIPLKELAPNERKNNIKGAFKLACNDVKLTTIVIIDDIYTTGATIDAVSAVFRAAGVKSVFALSLAIGQGI